MTLDGAGIARALAGVAVAVCLGVTAHGGIQRVENHHSSAQAPEIRALWVLRSSLASPESIATLVRSAKLHGFNALFVQVRGRGDAYYGGGIEPRAAELASQPSAFDPLATVLKAAQGAGLRVHAWINVNLVSSATELPKSREHLVHRRPQWLMVPRDLGQELARVDPASPRYVQRIARWTRERSDGIEGLYASPVTPPAVEHLAAVVRDLARRYPLDGMHFDYARYPNETFDYSRSAIAEFRRSIESQLPPGRRRELASRHERDVLAFPDALPDEWRRFRTARMTALLSRLRDVARSERPHAAISVAAGADMQEAVERRFQEWPRWLEKGLIDAVCPMAYTTEPQKFAEQITAAVAAAGQRRVWAGIGAYRLTPEQTIDNIATARRVGAAGIILFSYDSLVDPRQTSRNYLFVVGRGAFTATRPADPLR